ncbi:MAG: hypothetical protein AB7I33_10610 [Gemmatimonadales bacterium]
MTRPLLVLTLMLGLNLAAAPAPAAAMQTLQAGRDTVNQCLVCHSAQREAAVVGVHSEHGIQCVACHGGDPTARELPAAHRGRFLGTPTKVQTAQLCGSCHSDPDRMREFALPTGQLAEFRTSEHGQLLFGRGNTDAPTCTDCHGTHIIYPPDDARSHVYPTNIPGTCAHCHSDDKLMAKYRLKTGQFEDFKQSAHGDALYRQQNFAAPTCVGCHGAHSALPPTVTEIANVCARCHVLVGQAFAGGPHAAASQAGKIQSCLACHSNHGTERVPVSQISTVCDKCHASDTRLHQMGVDLQHRLTQVDADMESARQAIGQLQLAGRRVDDYRFRYQTALTYYLEIAQAQHRLDPERLDDLERKVRSISVDLDAAAEVSREEHWEEKLLLIPVWFLTLSAIVLGWMALRSLKASGAGREF